MNKLYTLSVLLILTLASVTITETLASTPKPSIPEFTVKFINSSYDIPTSSSIDPYTGQTIITPIEHVDNRTIEVKVKNQPFTPYGDDKSSFTINLYYNIRVRGHFVGNWTEVFSIDNSHPVKSNVDYTIISLPLGGDVGPFASLPTNSNAQIDFQVEAMIGYFSRTVSFASWYFAGEESGWSDTQTLTIPEAVSSSAPSLSSVPDQSVAEAFFFGLGWLGVGVIVAVLAVLLVAVAVFLRCRKVKAPVK